MIDFPSPLLAQEGESVYELMEVSEEIWHCGEVLYCIMLVLSC